MNNYTEIDVYEKCPVLENEKFLLRIATKVVPAAAERKAAVEQMGFVASEKKLIGFHDKKTYGDYYVLKK